MRVFRGLPHPLLKMPSAVAIGNFDGVHTGHQALLHMVVESALARGLVSSVVTFEPHPRELVNCDNMLTRISTLRDKMMQIEQTGIERVYLLPFSHKLASLSGREFVTDVLVEGLSTHWVTVGEDFRFGQDRKGDLSLLEEMGQTLGFESFVSPTLFHTNERVSSSRIRKVLAAGDLFEAGIMLGRHYTMTGRVIHGAALGRTLGFPTLNMAPIPPGSHAKPAVSGSFAVLVHGLAQVPLAGVASIGRKPTVTKDKTYLLETHVFDWKGNAYGKVITVEFIERLRDEKKFNSLDELKSAINDDALRARQILGCPPPKS